MDPMFYTSELEYAPKDIAPFLQWYSGRHSADLFRAGFYTTTCYRAVTGGLTIVDMYQADTWDVFTGDGYKVRDKDPYAKERLAPRTGNVNTVYTYRSLQGAGDPARKIDADWVALVRFESDDAPDDALIDWLQAQEVGRLMALGAASVRLVRRTKDRPNTSSYRPAWAILTEWGGRPPQTADLTGPLADHLDHPLADGDAFVGFRLFPWPDDAALLRDPPAGVL